MAFGGVMGGGAADFYSGEAMSNTVLIDTRSVPMSLVSPTNISADASIVEPAPTITKPVSNTHGGVFALGEGGEQTASGIKLVFFGLGSDTNTFSAFVYGWEFLKSTAGKTGLWVPTLLATFTTITLVSEQPGVDGTDVPSSNFFAAAATLGVGNSGISVEVVSPGEAAAEIAHVVVDTKGCKLMEVRFAMGGSATSGNALWKRL
jgi:hypothetical protein